MNNKKGIVYTITNKDTLDTYVGITLNSIHQRKLDHLERARRGEKGKLFESLSAFGEEAFEFSEIDTTYSIDELAEKEKMYIKQYRENGTSLNFDAGGGIKKSVYKYNLSGKLDAKFACLEAAAKTIDSTKQHISRACLSTNKTYKGFQWSYHYQEPFEANLDRRKRNVLQFSLDGKLIKEFNSVADASKQTGISKSCIARVCRKEREKSGGFIWMYNVKPNKL